jgi:hypothetical protein
LQSLPWTVGLRIRCRRRRCVPAIIIRTGGAGVSWADVVIAARRNAAST